MFRMSGLNSRPTAALLLLLALLAPSLGGCNYPKVPAQDPMPLVIRVDPDATITAQFPWCSGDGVDGAGVTVGDDGVLRMASEGNPPTKDSVLTMTINASTLDTGVLSPDLVVARQLPRFNEYGPEDVDEVFVQTFRFEASVYLSTLREVGGDMWLVVGDEGDSDAKITKIDPSSAAEALATFCTSE